MTQLTERRYWYGTVFSIVILTGTLLWTTSCSQRAVRSPAATAFDSKCDELDKLIGNLRSTSPGTALFYEETKEAVISCLLTDVPIAQNYWEAPDLHKLLSESCKKAFDHAVNINARQGKAHDGRRDDSIPDVRTNQTPRIEADLKRDQDEIEARPSKITKLCKSHSHP